MTTAILVDDEPNLLSYLDLKLRECWPELDIIGHAANGLEALVLVKKRQPDIIFLDIRMPGQSGLVVAEKLPKDIRVVFVTAYDQYAVDAFQKAAVDYLLKPVTVDRLKITIERLKAAPIEQPSADLKALMAAIKEPEAFVLKWIKAGRGEVTELVNVDDVVFFKSEQKYTVLFTKTHEHLIRKSISELVDELDPDTFWQIHRGVIVNAREILNAKKDFRGRYQLNLKSRSEVLRTSPSYSHLFRQM
ncbi:MAG: LytR/AlgR family response regulator transcription factor [Pseudomonadales bacterium]|jgi:DNA-binding LytR/AlgR family response regulator